MKVIPHLCAVLLGAAVGSAAETVWTFSNPGDRFAPTAGAGTMAYYDPGGDGWGPSQTVFGKASSFGLPAMTGGDADVMLFPTCTALQGYVVSHGALENGPYGETDGLISNYTMIMDILYPTANDGVWRALWQTDPTNAQDAEFYVRNQASGGIGISGNYQGRVTPNAWHRIAIVVRAAPSEGYFQRFIDGQFVGGTSLPALTATTVSLNIVHTWSAQAGVRLQRSDALATGSWADVPGTLGAGTWSELIVAGGRRYFRLAR